MASKARHCQWIQPWRTCLSFSITFMHLTGHSAAYNMQTLHTWSHMHRYIVQAHRQLHEANLWNLQSKIWSCLLILRLHWLQPSGPAQYSCGTVLSSLLGEHLHHNCATTIVIQLLGQWLQKMHHVIISGHWKRGSDMYSGETSEHISCQSTCYPVSCVVSVVS